MVSLIRSSYFSIFRCGERIQWPPESGSVNVHHEVLLLVLSTLSVQLIDINGSTITSQLSMTFGGSLFPGGLGGMFIEVLPFLRGIASAIRNALGDDHPALIPTVMAAYAMTSFIMGIIFLCLGLSKFGRLV